MKNLIVILLGTMLFCTSCNHHVYYSDIQPIPNEKWDIKAPLTFTMDITDSTQYFDMYIHVRNTTDFETQNFYVFMNTCYPDGHNEQDTLGFILCDKFGKWTGKGQGRIKDNKFLFQPKVRFPFNGTYTFTITQGMRENPVKGITDFGITLENYKERKK